MLEIEIPWTVLCYQWRSSLEIHSRISSADRLYSHDDDSGGTVFLNPSSRAPNSRSTNDRS
jgi:hypothetical protein